MSLPRLVRPSHINTANVETFEAAFGGEFEIGRVAYWIVRFIQSLGGDNWAPVSLNAHRQFCLDNGQPYYGLSMLAAEHLISLRGDSAEETQISVEDLFLSRLISDEALLVPIEASFPTLEEFLTQGPSEWMQEKLTAEEWVDRYKQAKSQYERYGDDVPEGALIEVYCSARFGHTRRFNVKLWDGGSYRVASQRAEPYEGWKVPRSTWWRYFKVVT